MEEEDGAARSVRFDDECVLIPDQLPAARQPLVLTKSYSLPLFNVPIPVFRRRRSSRSPPSLSTSPVAPRTLPSCLVHHPPSSPPLSPVRRPAVSASASPAVTVPLRACCAACEAATEHALAEGDQWTEHFSRGARRRRSASLESCPSESHVSLPAVNVVRGSAAAVTAFALRVDEVDQRRRFAFSNEEDHYAALRAELDSSLSPLAYPNAPDIVPDGYRLRSSPIAEEESEDASSAAGSVVTAPRIGFPIPPAPLPSSSSFPRATRSASWSSSSLSPSSSSPRTAGHTPAADAHLFPLPRRSPSSTPSPRASPVPSTPSSLGVGLTPNLGGSSSRLSSPAGSTSDEDEDILGPSLSRRASMENPPPNVETAPPQLAVLHSTSPPVSPRTTSPTRPLSPRGPRPSRDSPGHAHGHGFMHMGHPHMSAFLASAYPHSHTPPRPPPHAQTASFSSSTSSSSSSTSTSTASQRTHGDAQRARSQPLQHPHPHSPDRAPAHTKRRKASFTASLAALRGAGADVLKGVSAAAMGMGGIGGAGGAMG